MTLTIEIPDELQARLEREAKARGTDVSALVAELLDAAAQETAALEQTPYDSTRLKRFLADMAQFSDQIPDLPDEALSRESIYCDHD
ncbi:MAG TPA: hypothetical protein VG345_02240 [Bryobacteraceae bacterium]|jgi:predicted transcriptional regulator|nr:hypothetical protein [Bryobacteraceae bacterium]